MAGSPAYKRLLDDAWELHQSKNAGYAGEDNPDPWANFRMSEAFGVNAVDGCLVRMSDKYIRVTNLRKNPGNDKVNESIKDTLRDLAAYAFIAICLMDEEENKTCHCNLSTAADGHIHEQDGTILCLHGDGEEGTLCPNALR